VWGNLLSAYAPVLDKSTGEVLAIVGTDVSIEQYHNIMKNQLFVIFLNTFVFVLLTVIFALLSSNTIEKKIEKKLVKDSLTGVYNRGYFNSFLKAHVKAIKKRDNPAILFIADVDHFKKVNDTYGHPFGDKVLINISSVINNHMRKTDCFARYGGEEFIGVMPGLNLEDAREVIGRIHNAVGTAVTHDELHGIKLQVTISIGVTQLNRNEAVENTIKKADIALYEAKKDRNMVVYKP
jgi:diguanylate cyclase (GGDEF)-like protein